MDSKDRTGGFDPRLWDIIPSDIHLVRHLSSFWAHKDMDVEGIMKPWIDNPFSFLSPCLYKLILGFLFHIFSWGKGQDCL